MPRLHMMVHSNSNHGSTQPPLIVVARYCQTQNHAMGIAIVNPLICFKCRNLLHYAPARTSLATTEQGRGEEGDHRSNPIQALLGPADAFGCPFLLVPWVWLGGWGGRSGKRVLACATIVGGGRT